MARLMQSKRNMGTLKGDTRKLSVGTGPHTKLSHRLQFNSQPNDVRDETTITKYNESNPFNLSKASLERVKLIRLVFDLLLLSSGPDKRNPYWYGDKFDELYDKELSELRILLSVYSKSRGKPYI
jgi:hypothetical protein